MLLEDLIINVVQIIRAKVLEPILDSPSSKPTPIVSLRLDISRVRAQQRAYPGPTSIL